MSIQLRLVDPPEGAPERRKAQRARSVRTARARRAHWRTDWRLDASARRVGRQGVAAARAALRSASQLPKAS